MTQTNLSEIAGIMNRNPEPDTPCQVCGSLDWWFRLPNMIYGKIYSPGAWVCGRCHPMPGAVPAGDIIVCGSGKMRSYTIHPDGSSSCRWFPDNDVLESKSAPVPEVIPEPEPVKLPEPDALVLPCETCLVNCRQRNHFYATDDNIYVCDYYISPDGIPAKVKNESEESMKKVVKKKTVKQESGTNEKRSKGRPSLNISLKRICDALKTEKSIQGAAVSLGCSRGYIYKVAGVERVREIIKGVKNEVS